jgi:hypothetical protein
MGSFGQTSLKQKISCKCTFNLGGGVAAHWTRDQKGSILILLRTKHLSLSPISLMQMFTMCFNWKVINAKN